MRTPAGWTGLWPTGSPISPALGCTVSSSQGMVTLDGAPAKPASRLRRCQRVIVIVPDPVESHLKPQRMELGVVHEDSDVIVIDKPAGLTVHPGPGHPDETLANAVLAMCPGLQDIGGTVRPGIVHRLDKDTSGLIAVAKNERAQSELSSQVRRRGFTKAYLALTLGRLRRREAVTEAPIGRDPANRKRMAVVSNGKESTTRYRVERYYDAHSLAEVRPTTGRTHQDTGPLRLHRPPSGRRLHVRRGRSQARTPLPPRAQAGVSSPVDWQICRVRVSVAGRAEGLPGSSCQPDPCLFPAGKIEMEPLPGMLEWLRTDGTTGTRSISSESHGASRT